MTSNATQEQLRATMRPEFLNRIDEIITFHPLREDEIRQIVLLQLKHVEKMLKENGITLEVKDSAISLLAQEGYDPDFGARPVKRAIQRTLLNPLSKFLLSSKNDAGKPIEVAAHEGELTFS